MNQKVNKLKFVSMLLTVFLVLLSVFTLTGCEDENTKHYTLPGVKVGETFEIKVLAGGCTYRWDYEIGKKSGIEYISYEYIPEHPEPDWCGGVGDGIYTFKATKEGNYQIKFVHKSIFENKPPKETNIYEIKVTK